MPELPEVETTLRGISAHVLNSPITQINVRNSRLRWPVPDILAKQLPQQSFVALKRRAKYLLLITNHDETVIIHLGMSGSLRIALPDEPYDKHDHVELCFENGITLRLKDPRRFGAVLWTNEAIENHPLLVHLGPEPLSEAFNSTLLFKRSRNKKQAVKQFIMDSKVVVGIGNINANEA